MIQSLSLMRVELVEAAGRDQLPCVGREERIRLQRARALEALSRGIGGDVEQQRRHAGVGEVRGDLRAHRARAEDGHRPNHHPAIVGRATAPTPGPVTQVAPFSASLITSRTIIVKDPRHDPLHGRGRLLPRRRGRCKRPGDDGCAVRRRIESHVPRPLRRLQRLDDVILVGTCPGE